MPLDTFRCPACGHEEDILSRNKNERNAVKFCPKCPANVVTQLERVFGPSKNFILQMATIHNSLKKW